MTRRVCSENTKSYSCEVFGLSSNKLMGRGWSRRLNKRLKLVPCQKRVSNLLTRIGRRV